MRAIKAKVKKFIAARDAKERVAGSGSGEANTSSTPDADATSTPDEQATHEGVEN